MPRSLIPNVSDDNVH